MKKTSPLICILLAALALCLTPSAEAQSARRTGGGSRLPSSSAITAAEKPLPPGWKLYSFGDSAEAWSVAFPVQPVEKTEPFKGVGEPPPISHNFEGETRSGYYAVVYVNVPMTMSRQSVDEKRELMYEVIWKRLTGGVEESFKAEGYKDVVVSPVTQRKVSVNGYEGREGEFLIGPAKTRVRVIFTERRIYMLISAWIKDGFEEERDSFFDLFEIRPAR